jgi:hypothetical protein
VTLQIKIKDDYLGEETEDRSSYRDINEGVKMNERNKILY